MTEQRARFVVGYAAAALAATAAAWALGRIVIDVLLVAAVLALAWDHGHGRPSTGRHARSER